MRKNVKEKSYTAEGGKAVHGLSPQEQLRRSVLSCLLWEKEFYEDGESIAERISQLCEHVPGQNIMNLALEARIDMNLRHVPLLLILGALNKQMTNFSVAEYIGQIVQRPDEMTELLALYWADGRCPIAAQLKKGLAKAFNQFDAYALAKYNRDGAVKLRDVMFMCHPRPKNGEQGEVWQKLAEGELKAPDTWEVALSAGEDKKEVFTRLLMEEKLGYMALLRNLRNMDKAGVDEELVRFAILARKGARRVLPFRYTAAARAVPHYEPYIDQALCDCINELTPLVGKTHVLIDVSGSMNYPLSSRSDLTRMDAAATLGAIIPGDVRLWTFSYGAVEVPPRKGMAGVEAIINSQRHGWTDLRGAIHHVNRHRCDRLIVITDEQSQTGGATPSADKAYLINVASNRNGVGYRGKWVHIDGFSEAVLRYIHEYEDDDKG